MQVSMWVSAAMSLLLDQWEELILTVSGAQALLFGVTVNCNCEVEGLDSAGFIWFGNGTKGRPINL